VEAEKELAAEAARKANLNDKSNMSSLINELDASDVIEDADKIDKLSNRQIIEVISGAMDTAMAALAAKTEDRLNELDKPRSQKIDGMEKMLMSIAANMDLKNIRAKFRDFDDYKEDIAVVIKRNPSVNFEDAYYIAKSRKAGNVPARTDVETERPDDLHVPESSSSVPTGASDYDIIAARGRHARGNATPKAGIVGFRSLVSDGIDRLNKNA